jgi:monoamine oxidase
MKWLKGLVSSRPGPARHSDDDLVLSLDGEWRPDHEDTHLEFVSEKDAEQVTASALRAKAPLDLPTMLSAALRLLATRQEAFESAGGPGITFSEVETHYRDGGVDVAFIAEDAAGLQARVVVCARPLRLVTLSYHKYAPLLTPAEFQRRYEAVRAGLQVR